MRHKGISCSALGCIAGLTTALAVARAHAQPVDPFDPDAAGGPVPPAVPTTPGAASTTSPPKQGAGEGELTPEELAEIERATGADAGTLRDAGRGGGLGDSGSGKAPLPVPVPAGAAAFLPDISVVLGAALAAFSTEEPLQAGGHDPSSSGFNLQQVELSLGKSVDPYFRFDANLVFTLEGVEVEEAYATTLDLPAKLQLRAGQLLTRFGRINATHPHGWDFADQPFFWSKVWGSDGNRGLGAELSVLLPLPWYVEILGSTTEAAGEGTARSFYGAEDLGVRSPIDFENLLAVKQFFDLSHDWSLLFGVSAANGPNPSGRHSRTDVFGTDLYLKYRPITRQSFTVVSLQSEWMLRRRQVPDDVLVDVGGYAQLFYRFEQRWGAALRYEYATATQNRSGARVVDPLDPSHAADRHRASAALTFWPTEFSRIRLQGSADVPRWLERPTWAGFLQLETVTGSHGAHAF
ncbi:MAG: zinc-regulated TonB-dependent outer membrane receptor [Myxococcales bacterium]|nr:zinc-regulated TonB-dependent outer membrane receptor [Myxococcales bacterium]